MIGPRPAPLLYRLIPECTHERARWERDERDGLHGLYNALSARRPWQRTRRVGNLAHWHLPVRVFAARDGCRGDEEGSASESARVARAGDASELHNTTERKVRKSRAPRRCVGAALSVAVGFVADWARGPCTEAHTARAYPYPAIYPRAPDPASAWAITQRPVHGLAALRHAPAHAGMPCAGARTARRLEGPGDADAVCRTALLHATARPGGGRQGPPTPGARERAVRRAQGVRASPDLAGTHARRCDALLHCTALPRARETGDGRSGGAIM
ncbi:hypothetical protein HYPSUDRAFT_204821 [Hypholoma sublateritium FD-334 SS-4]|uniref:Uncharacterized protein n=1 Tax=Hypholoma sublateritium (strain FD-334 SS-4) TaxID=945553 RepID=A0A0D2M783_HYPSF|nr:hypothetical protein HYPSUDRAFT_204821 [Hypholoma sublateritium FD-334 SS-4]